MTKAKTAKTTRPNDMIRTEVRLMNLATEVGFLALTHPYSGGSVIDGGREALSRVDEILAVLVELRRAVRDCEKDYRSERAGTVRWNKEIQNG